MGKSHFLWECQNEIQSKNLYASLFIYGKYFNDVASIPWADILEYAKAKEFLLVIDGINEIVDADKRNYLYSQISSLLGCKYIRIFVSYRTYSLQSLIGGQNEESFIDSLLGNTINFAGVDFDSSITEIVTNFKVDISYFYNILYSNNPMQLRMLIESEILNNSRLYEEELSCKSVVSITFIYERFIKSACKHLWKEHEQIYWEAIKDLCKVLYKSNRSYFLKEDICFAGIDSNKFIADLKNGGYIDTYDYERYYFSWEQLSNYLIARSFNDEINGKTDDDIIALYSKKALEFPRISQFLISVLVDRYYKKFDKFISFITKANPDINEETLLNIVIKNISDRQKLQDCLSVKNALKVFSMFGGIPKRVFNCETYFFKDFFDRNTIIIKDELFYGLTKAEVFRKLKNNLHNLGYSPMKFEEEQIKLCTPLNTYNEVIDKLDLIAIERLNKIYTSKKNTKWADSKRLSFKSIKSILVPYSVDGVEWVMLGCYITNHNYYNGKGRKKNYSEECIIVSCATNYSKNRTCSLDRDMTIEIQDYDDSVLDYADVYSDFCKLIKPIKTDRSLFEENNLSFPPSSIISRLGLKFDSKRAAWVNNLNEAVILCNNNLYRWYNENIGRTIYIKKEYFEGIKDILQLYYYIFTEKLSCETGYYSNESDMHIIIKDGRIRKVCKNNGQKGMGEPKTYKKCVKCSIYKANEEHEIAIEKAWHHFDEYFD